MKAMALQDVKFTVKKTCYEAKEGEVIEISQAHLVQAKASGLFKFETRKRKTKEEDAE